MMKVEAKLKNNIGDTLKGLQGEELTSILFSGAAAMANVIYTDIIDNPSFPEKTGLLKSAIYRTHAKDNSTDRKIAYHVGVNKKKAPHWHWVEFGNSRIPAQPYIRPAADKLGEAVDAGMKRIAERLV